MTDSPHCDCCSTGRHGSGRPDPVATQMPISRRALLGALGALTVADLWPMADAFAQSGARMVIDTHHHFYPPAYQKA
jgi:hypothetical protein